MFVSEPCTCETLNHKDNCKLSVVYIWVVKLLHIKRHRINLDGEPNRGASQLEGEGNPGFSFALNLSVNFASSLYTPQVFFFLRSLLDTEKLAGSTDQTPATVLVQRFVLTRGKT